jgi:NAD(P)-dependent dehydrogenase (short-subunit alcohol dehydrogenase family)
VTSSANDRYAGDAVRTAALDVADPIAAEAAVGTAIDNFGGLDVVVNNAVLFGGGPHRSARYRTARI